MKTTETACVSDELCRLKEEEEEEFKQFAYKGSFSYFLSISTARVEALEYC